MKGAFETFVLLILGMTFTLLGFSMVEITFKYNGARLYQESIISIIERHNRYDADIETLISDANQQCSTCTYIVDLHEDKYLVTVNFDINVSVIRYSKTASIQSMTQRIL